MDEALDVPWIDPAVIACQPRAAAGSGRCHRRQSEVQAKSDADLKKVITAGSGKMKPAKGLTDADVANVVAYLRTLAQK